MRKSFSIVLVVSMVVGYCGFAMAKSVNETNARVSDSNKPSAMKAPATKDDAQRTVSSLKANAQAFLLRKEAKDNAQASLLRKEAKDNAQVSLLRKEVKDNAQNGLSNEKLSGQKITFTDKLNAQKVMTEEKLSGMMSLSAEKLDAAKIVKGLETKLDAQSIWNKNKE